MSEAHREAEDKSSLLSYALDRHFLACAAVAAGAVVAGSPSSADAEIQYSGPLDIAINPSTAVGIYLDVNNLTTSTSSSTLPGWDLNIYNFNRADGRKVVRLLTPDKNGQPARFAAPVGVTSSDGRFGYISKLGGSVAIDSGSNFITPSAVNYSAFAYHDPTGGYDATMWNGGVTDGYMGFRFTDDGGATHHGWARLSITPFSASSSGFNVTLHDFAFEDVANASIETGAIPEPASLCALGLLALGAVGIRPTRKNKA
jgi:hypothetical protein